MLNLTPQCPDFIHAMYHYWFRPEGRRGRRDRLRMRDAWRKEGIPAPRSLRPRWRTYAAAAKRLGVTMLPGYWAGSRVDARERVGKLPRYFVVNGVPFSPRR